MKFTRWRIGLLLLSLLGGNLSAICTLPSASLAEIDTRSYINRRIHELNQREIERLLEDVSIEYQRGNLAKASILFKQALSLFSDTNSEFLTQIGFSEAMGFLQKALTTSGINPRVRDTLFFYGIGYMYEFFYSNYYSNSNDSIKYFNRSLNISREIRDRRMESLNLLRLSQAHERMLRPQQTSVPLTYSSAALRISREIKDTKLEIRILEWRRVYSLYRSGGFRNSGYINDNDYERLLHLYGRSGDRLAAMGLAEQRCRNRNRNRNRCLLMEVNTYEALGDREQIINSLIAIIRNSADRPDRQYLPYFSFRDEDESYRYINNRTYMDDIKIIDRIARIITEMIDDGEANHRDYIYVALLYHYFGQYFQAITYYEKSLSIPSSILPSLRINGLDYSIKKYDEVEALYRLGNSYYHMNRPSEAIKYLNKATIAIENRLATVRVSGSRGEMEVQKIKNMPRVYNDILSLLSLIEYQQGDFERSLIVAESGRQRILRDFIARRQNPPTSVIPAFTNLQSLAQQRRATIVSYSIIRPELRKLLLTNTDIAVPNLILIHVITPDGKLTIRTRPYKPNYSDSDNLNNPRSIVDEISQNTSVERTTLLATNECPADSNNNNTSLQVGQNVRLEEDNPNYRSRRILCINFTNNTATVTSLSGSETIQNPLTKIIPLPASQNTRYPTLTEFYNILIEPIADLLPKDPQQPIIFVPNKDFNRVPFAALQDANRNYLIEKHPILMVPSLGILAQISQRQPSSHGVLVAGNPTLPTLPLSRRRHSLWESRQREAPPSFKLLPYSEREAVNIAKIYQASPLLGAQATEDAVKRNISSARVIHLASHAIGDSYNTIALAAGNNEDGYLTLEEIFDLRLNADLVVLSGCNTGELIDSYLKSDNNISLPLAFIAAGARSTISSLWTVEDKSTEELMTEFHRQWLGGEGKNKALALQAAMLKVKETYSSNPYHWAAMTLIGEMD
jgi:CHAT domain-containing protein/tetratricopeptide (TPR) repeat protein